MASVIFLYSIFLWLQVKLQPFIPSCKSDKCYRPNLNKLETIYLSSAIGILFCGLISKIIHSNETMSPGLGYIFVTLIAILSTYFFFPILKQPLYWLRFKINSKIPLESSNRLIDTNNPVYSHRASRESINKIDLELRVKSSSTLDTFSKRHFLGSKKLCNLVGGIESQWLTDSKFVCFF